ncbi:TetR/AcrR family transcriptional regulator [Kutzneria sp. CA-103260]|uniref:TetR/AcrR family transcriptional regulator n=1 Tax=Kutzneria sp. CA-103260 TaxID=2802641 RepID=UPI001BADC5B2|nr:TetR/AcrR family transcriptional regulator [Kutzneria sp. CA-103260]QUQ65778.1 TetR family transcriptional regulator [Kutzneria sp. CA-103260]
MPEKTAARMGRPPLTERRKAETRLEVARVAVDLFLAKGVADTTAEEIAEAAGISARTLWRYFPTKESFVTPMLTGGIEHTAERLRSWRRDQDAADLVDLLCPPNQHATDDLKTVRSLIRLTRTEPGLRAVWLEAHRDAEPAFARALADRAGLAEPDLAVTVQAAMINVALRVAVEHFAFHAEVKSSVYQAAMREALLTAVRGFPG